MEFFSTLKWGMPTLNPRIYLMAISVGLSKIAPNFKTQSGEIEYYKYFPRYFTALTPDRIMQLKLNLIPEALRNELLVYAEEKISKVKILKVLSWVFLVALVPVILATVYNVLAMSTSRLPSIGHLITSTDADIAWQFEIIVSFACLLIFGLGFGLCREALKHTTSLKTVVDSWLASRPFAART